jgi:large conductance mechanosensitive channel
MLREFRAFILRGNLIDLAVAVVLGTAFGAVVAALVKDLVTPLIAAIGGKPDFSNLKFKINGSEFLYGDFINALLAFVIVAAVIFFLVIKPINALMDRRKVDTATDATTRACPQCLSDIPIAAQRCAFCTSELAPLPPAKSA